MIYNISIIKNRVLLELTQIIIYKEIFIIIIIITYILLLKLIHCLIHINIEFLI